MNRPDTEVLGTLAVTLLKTVMQMPEPMPRFFLNALHRDIPELREEIDAIQRRSVPFLQLNESRRTTMHNPESGIRFASVLITGETDEGQIVCWPQFMLGKLPDHDMDMLELSLMDWLDVVRRNKRSKQAQNRQVREVEPPMVGKEDLL